MQVGSTLNAERTVARARATVGDLLTIAICIEAGPFTGRDGQNMIERRSTAVLRKRTVLG